MHSHTGLRSLVALRGFTFLIKQDIETPANCLCIEIYPHCIFDDEAPSQPETEDQTPW